MIRVGSKEFREVWLADFEFTALPGERPDPVCLVAWEMGSGRRLQVWRDELLEMRRPPYSIAQDSLFVCFYASAEMSCHLSLGWPMPMNVLDLYAEFRNLTNGLTLPSGNGLLGALIWFGLGGIEAAEKETMRNLVLRGGPWTPQERTAILEYCKSDVKSLSKLLVKMVPNLDIDRALLRGRYMEAAARIEDQGIPIDTVALNKLRRHWDGIQDHLIGKIDIEYQVFERRIFKVDRFTDWLVKSSIPWPRLDTGRLDLTEDTFREMARIHPRVSLLHELRVALSQMRLSDLVVGRDGRNRCMLSAFRSRTGRNQPSNSKFVFGPSVWLRGLIRPEPDCGLAYIDWAQQEFGIAAALSEDPCMIEAYESGDPYLAFAKHAKAVPPDASKETHPSEREQFKACVLAVQYGMGEKSLACRIHQSIPYARELLRLHRETYPKFWRWSNGIVDYAMVHGKLWTTFGWNVHISQGANPRFLQNFPMQANGSEMLRIACFRGTEQGIKICAPVHDAILIEAPCDELEEKISATQKVMADASAIVLNGFRLRSEAKIVRYPERYMDERGLKMWQTVWSIIEDLHPSSSNELTSLEPERLCNFSCAESHTRSILLYT